MSHNVRVIGFHPAGNFASVRIVADRVVFENDCGSDRYVRFDGFGRHDRLRGLFRLGSDGLCFRDILDIRQSAVLGPVSAVVSADAAVAGGNLHLVRPFGRTLDGKSVADVNADMSFHPDRFADLNLREVGGDSLADFNHAVRADVRDAVARIGSASVDAVFVAAPPPENAFN